MRRILLSFQLLTLLLLISCSSEKYKLKTATDANGYTYEYVKGDPMQVRMYTLKNGLKVYLSVNKDAPKVQTYISVHAGSLLEPEETTGLAHYFEHLMFKGSSKIGTLNWEKERPLLDEISDLFEQRKQTTDSIEKIKIFARIDSLATEASKYAIPNEYDKLVSLLGANGTNAFTDYEGTAYINDIPSNELERWLKLEYERFSFISLRLFHTELETVYEEYNMYEDRDQYRIWAELYKNLFKKHPLRRDVIGYPEHLKNPSIVNIRKFFDTYYVPNNMAVILCGDIDMDKTIQLVDATFGQFKEKPLVRPELPKEDSITSPVVSTIYGPDAEFTVMAYRFNGYNTNERKFVTLVDMLLNNNAAGLIDLDLVQQQKVLRAGSSPIFYNDYGMHYFYAWPKKGQTLEEAKDLVLQEIEKIKKGEFDDWLLPAVINDLRLNSIRNIENNDGRASLLNSMFFNGSNLVDELSFHDNLEKITKEELVNFAKEHYGNNYALVYKKQGENKDRKQLTKPKITPVDINRIDQSAYYKEFEKIITPKIKPEFVDFNESILKKELKPGIELNYITNTTNELFELNYIVDMGKSHNKKLALAVGYLPMIGTHKYTPAQLQQEFYKFGLKFSVNTGDERSYVSISGLSKSFEKGAELIEHFLSDAKSDTAMYAKYIEKIQKERADRKLNQDEILRRAMSNFGMYGKTNPFTDILSLNELKGINPDELTSLVKEITKFNHRIFYYGPDGSMDVESVLLKHHKTPDKLNTIPAVIHFPEEPFNTSKVYFVNYEMVQTNFMYLNKSVTFNPEVLPFNEIFNNYYGAGLSSIVFQEIREARGLAYAASAYIRTPAKKDRSFFISGFVGTQADKLKEASLTLNGLLASMKKDTLLFKLAKESVLKNIESERITKSNIFWRYLSALDKGITYDIRKEIYEKVPGITIEQLGDYFIKNLNINKPTWLVIGKREKLDLKHLKTLGEFKELTLDEIFNY